MQSNTLPLPLTLRGEADFQVFFNSSELLQRSSDKSPLASKGDDFFEYLKEIYESCRIGEIPDILVEYTGINILGYLPKTYLRSLGIYTRSRYIQDLSCAQQERVLYNTYWFSRCKKEVKNAYLRLIYSRKMNKVRELINSGTGIMISLLLSAPMHHWTYKYTDQIMVSVMSNLVMDPKYLLRWKKWKKTLRKECLTGTYDGHYRKEWSWFSHLAPYFGKINSRLDAVRLMALTQTRNTGLPIDKFIETESINKFRNTITEPCGEPKDTPGRFLEQALFKFVKESTISRAMHVARESISTTSCFEIGRKEKTIEDGSVVWTDAGKVSEARAFLQMEPETPYVDLHTGIVTQKIIPENKIGDRLFHQCLRLYLEGYDDLYNVKLDVIREPGPKARVITASSFVHAEILQVWSHITLEVLKSIPWCRSGISKSRHGWEMAESISPEDPSLGWMFGDDEYHVVTYGLSTDLEEATDHFNWYVAKDLIRTLNSYLEIPKWYGAVVEELLTTPREVFYKGEHFCTTHRGCLMGDPGTKTLLTALGASVIQKCLNDNLNFFARVIGDDFAAISTSRESLEQSLEAYRSWGMKISQDDTYISNRYIFFTEELIVIPRSVHDTIDRIKKSRRWGRSPYIDSIKIRLLIDVKKNRDDFSYTPIGRITQLGTDISYLRQGCDPAALFHLGSFFQDFCLDLIHRYEGFVYFPAYAIGEGKPPLFNSPVNTISFWANQFRGKFLNSYLQCVYHIVQFLRNNNEEYEDTVIRYAATGPFRHSQNQAWKVNYKPLEDPRFSDFAIGTIGRYRSVSKPILARLKNYIISESEIIGRMAKADFVSALLFNEEPQYKEAQLLDFDTYKAEKVTPDDIDEFFRVWLKDPNQFHTIQMEEYFDRAPIEEILLDDYVLKVDFLLECNKGEDVDEHESADRMEDHDQVALYEWFKRNRGVIPPDVEDIPRRSLSDDEILLSEREFYNRHPNLFIITDDKKLAEEMANYRSSLAIPLRTYRIPVIDWLAAKCSYKAFKCTEIHDLNTVVDLGSYEAKMSQLNIHGVSNFTALDTLEEVPDIRPDDKYKPVKAYKGKLGNGSPIELPRPNTPRRYLVGTTFKKFREKKKPHPFSRLKRLTKDE